MGDSNCLISSTLPKLNQHLKRLREDELKFVTTESSKEKLDMTIKGMNNKTEMNENE